jgi:hypothetical protein
MSPMAARSTYLRRALWLSALSIAWTSVAGSIAIYAAIASVALIWRFRMEMGRPEHASRVEQAAERVVGLALIVLALYLVVGSVRSLAAQTHPEASFVSLALLVASAVALPLLAVAATLQSGALRADSILTGAAALLALIGLASVAATDAFGWCGPMRSPR